MNRSLPRSSRRRSTFVRLLVLACVASLTVLGLGAGPAEAAPTSGTRISGNAYYPRVIRLAHGSANGTLLASVTNFDGQGGNGKIMKSTDDGASWSVLSQVRDAASSDGLCCSSLYELPQALGDLPAGSILYSASYGGNSPGDGGMSVGLWASRDRGQTWEWRAQVARTSVAGGLWEPEMHLKANGDLVVHYSDESEVGKSQKLVERYSSDGRTFGQVWPTVRLADGGARPGMANVKRLANGTFLMTYEICGPNWNCEFYWRTSADGGNWGDPAQAGTRITASDGSRPRHAPVLTLVENGPYAGRLVLFGQRHFTSGGAVDAGSGATMLVSDNGPGGPWVRAAAPLKVPNVGTNTCQNYSPGVLPTADGTKLIEFTTDSDAADGCAVWFGTGAMPAKNPTYNFSTWGGTVNVRSDARLNASVVGTVNGGTQVFVTCQKQGDTVTAEGYTNNWWAKLRDQGGFISNIYISSPDAKLSGVPLC